MGTRVMYPIEVKEKAIQMKKENIAVRVIMEELGIKNKTQIETWWRWYRNGEEYRLVQPIGKQYTFGKGPEGLSEKDQLIQENKYLKMQVALLKKYPKNGKEVNKKTLVDLGETLNGEMSIVQFCRLFGISRSSYYRWRRTPNIGELTELETVVQQICIANHFRYGYRKITALMNRERRVSKNTIQRIMQKNNWQCRVKIKKKKRTGQPYHLYDNILQKNFISNEPLKKLVTDITYLPFGQKNLYLSSIMDLYNGEIIAYTIKDKQDVSLVLDTLEQLPKKCDGLLHSDQGSVYTSYQYQKQVQLKGITMSMSRKGTPSDNACIESFHASLKSETFYLDGLYNTPTSIVIQTVIDYIKYYNQYRIQQKSGYKSPIEYRQSIA
ncbi:IS3 family transposase [Listeria welshimeri]|nr:IS3 family transposase [Listeria welshimeri]MBF2461989.1 IS3 family transposase [Listeria welshimeri]